MCLIGALVLGLALPFGPGAGFARPFQELPASDGDVEGTWLGTLTVPGGQLRIVFHITRSPDGALTATLDSPDQAATGILVDRVLVADDSVRLEVGVVQGVYEGRLSEDGTTLDGRWKQGPADLPLVLKRTDEEISAPRRPQDPEKPYPYDEEEVAFDNPEAGVRLAGTLTLPRAAGPFPAALLITGSGPQDRDEALLGHRPFLVLADYLTRRGIAVLRYDDRGVGGSTGTFATATTQDFASDARAGVAYLKSRAEIDSRKIGLIGHSEGGIIAPMVAAASPDVAFIVLMAGTGLTGEQLLYLQGALIARANGAGEDAVALNRTVQERLFGVLKSEPDSAAADRKLRDILRETFDALSEEERAAVGLAGADEETLIEAQVRQLTSPWLRTFLTYDPLPALRAVRCPVLAVNGEKDLQVPPAENLAAIERALEEGGNEDYTVRELPGLNHLFQTAGTGSPREYAGIEETMAPAALEVIAEWILQQTKQDE